MNSIAKDNLKNRFISRIVLFVIAIIVFLNCALFLSSCDTGIDADLILKNIYPDFNLFIVHIVSSIIILVLCFWLVWTPTKRMIEARRQLASKNITDSENAKKEAYERLIEAEQKRMEAYEQAQFIIDKANKTSVIEHDKILQRAQAAAELIIKKAKNDIIGIQNSLLEEANKKIIDVTYYAVNEILKKEVTRVENDKIINDFIAKYEQGNEIKK